jgi:hypothetical protein
MKNGQEHFTETYSSHLFTLKMAAVNASEMLATLKTIT